LETFSPFSLGRKELKIFGSSLQAKPGRSLPGWRRWLFQQNGKTALQRFARQGVAVLGWRANSNRLDIWTRPERRSEVGEMRRSPRAGRTRVDGCGQLKSRMGKYGRQVLAAGDHT
jgi:hypothetical protein